jgi:uncharacterized protein
MLAANVPAWFEIPSADFERAIRFYESILGLKLMREHMGPMQMGVFPHQPPQASGCVVHAEGYRPAEQGTVVYLSLSADLNGPLARVEKAGGQVLLGKTALPDHMGYFAQFRDSEGNRVGLFSQE